jgi:GcrA cell cycle regulator
MSALESKAAEGWSDGRVARLREHHALGLTAAESARRLGGVSKNAVISKRHRLGLFSSLERAAEEPDRTVRGERRGARAAFAGPPPLPIEPLPNMDRPPPAGAQPKPLAARGPGQCAWPLGPAEQPGDFRTLFCCAPIEGGRTYCPCHAARASRPD